MINCSFTASSRTVSFIMTITDSFSASTIKSMIILSKSIMILRNVMSMLFQSIIIMTAYSKIVSSCIAISTIILSIQLDSSNTEFTKNN